MKVRNIASHTSTRAAIKAAILTARSKRVKRAPTPAIRELIYIEDDQGYSSTPVLFRTNCRKSVEALKAISYEPCGAGRLSTSFATFQKLLEKYGFECILIERLPENSKAPAGFEIVEGATGNY